MPLSPKQIQIMTEFAEAHKIKKIPLDLLFDDSRHFTINTDSALIHRYFQPSLLMNPVTRTAPQVFSGDRLKTTDIPDLDVATNFPIAATDTLIPVPAGSVWEIHEIIFFQLNDGNGANRAMDITIGQTLNTIAQSTVDITGITTTLGQLGGITMNSGFSPNLWTNTNGTLAVVTDENPLPITLKGGDNINGTSTNKQVGDLLELLVRYKDVTP